MAIDIGAGAADYNIALIGGYTFIDLTNPANASGSIDTIEVWMNNVGTGVKVGTFYGSSGTYTLRDYENLGEVTYGSKQTFTGLSCEVQTNDLVGFSAASGPIEANTSGGSGIYWMPTNTFGAGETTYTNFNASRKLAVYGTGEEATASLPIFAYHYNNMRP
jgi:hypothetical protein